MSASVLLVVSFCMKIWNHSVEPTPSTHAAESLLCDSAECVPDGFSYIGAPHIVRNGRWAKARKESNLAGKETVHPPLLCSCDCNFSQLSSPLRITNLEKWGSARQLLCPVTPGGCSGCLATMMSLTCACRRCFSSPGQVSSPHRWVAEVAATCSPVWLHQTRSESAQSPPLHAPAPRRRG